MIMRLGPSTNGRKRLLNRYPLVSNDTPRAEAFCLVAASVLFSDRAILRRGVFCLASVLSSRTSSLVHPRSLRRFLAMVFPRRRANLRNKGSSLRRWHRTASNCKSAIRVDSMSLMLERGRGRMFQHPGSRMLACWCVIALTCMHVHAA
jgi:hypothetical protein